MPFDAPLSAISEFFQWITGHSSGSTYVLTRWVFLRSLGVIYCIAFLSLWVQITGLIGERGILPAKSFLETVRGVTGPERYHMIPTIYWFTGATNFILHLTCALGIVGSILLVFGIAPTLNLIVLWALYLSVFSVGRDFLSFQWDILLLEVGFLSIFLAPTTLLPGLGKETAVSAVALFLLWWLLFRFMFESGVVKLTSGDSSWHDLTALTYHYFTQPLPTWTAWFTHQLPVFFHKLSAIFMYAAELLLPFLIFLPRPFKIVSSLGMIALMLIITATGNYNFFTILTIALCFLLLDDAIWQAVLPDRLFEWISSAGLQASPPVFFSLIVGCVAVAYLLISLFQVLQTMNRRIPAPQFVRQLERTVDPFRSVNTYGLFRVMTKNRPEIIIEGSNDGQHWEAYEFKWKPGDLHHRPRFIEPHQPRLDWQMWFAALSRFDRTVWFQHFLGRILEGEESVLRLLKRNPFPDAPPKFIRAELYEYTFTKSGEEGWWKREHRGSYAPVLSLGAN